MTIRSLLCAILLLPSLTLAAAEAPLSRIAFGSCANEKRKDQPVWDAINRLNPQLFILTGDNVYADSGDPAVLRTSYEKFATVPGFAALRENCPILATWDDHDYGLNDGGAEWEGKQAAKDAFMEFFRTPADSPVRSREGIYDAKVFGPEGRRVQIILLDTRWFRGPLERLGKEEHSKLKKEKGPWNGPYLEATDSTSTMIGQDQWKWLAEQLKVPAELRLIVSSIQVVPLDHGWEKWGNLPRERQRLLELVRDNATGVIFLSGDRHTADISMIPPETDGGPLYPIYDITASGLTQTGFSRESNRYRVGDENPFGKQNFGWIDIDWDEKDPTIKLEIRDVEGKVVRKAETTLNTLKPCTQ